jgi:hypothetical protein
MSAFEAKPQTNETDPLDKLLDETEFSAKTGVPVHTLRSQRNPNYDGDPIPYFKIGRSVRYTLRLWQKYLERHMVDPKRVMRR